MAQDVIFPDRPLFMVDRGWKNPHKDSAIQVVSFRGKKESEITRWGPRYKDLAIIAQKELPMQGAAFARDTRRTGPTHDSNVSSTSSRHFKFVNVAGFSRDRDPALRKFVRSHVMKGSRRSQKPRRKPVQKSTALSTTAKLSIPVYRLEKLRMETEISSELNIVLPGSATSFYGVLPCLMKPHYYGLLNYYLAGVARALYPLDSYLSYNPVKKSWFPLAITDELLLHAILLSAAVTLSFGTKNRQSTEASNIMKPIFRLLTARLTDQSNISDATIGAVSCLAMIENTFGNHAKWKVHATGLKEMILIRGGMSAIDPELQMKICRADIEGAVDSVSAPQLPPIIRSHSSIYSILQLSEASLRNNDLVSILFPLYISPQLRTTILDLSHFSEAIDYTFSRPDILLHPKAFDEDAISIQHELLSVPGTLESETATACRLGALIYLKTLTRGTEFSPRSSKVVVQKLQSSLGRIFQELRVGPLLIWLYFMGTIASQGQAARSWFIDRLLKFELYAGEQLTWASCKGALKRVLWIGQIHEGPGKQLWEEMEIIRATFIGQDW